MQKQLYSGENVIKRFEEAPPNIMILDSVMPMLDGVGVLRHLKDRNMLSDTYVFANSPQVNDEIVSLLQSLGAKYVIIKPTPFPDMEKRVMDILNVRSISDRIKMKMDVARDQLILGYLRMISIPPHLKGYRDMRRTLEYSVEMYGIETNLTKDIYPLVARDFNTSWQSVDRNIRTAIETAWTSGNMEGQHKLFGYTVSSSRGRPTNKELIAMITDRVISSLVHRGKM